MKINECKLSGVLIIEKNRFNDERGMFLETFKKKEYEINGINTEFVQDNFSNSSKNVLRGLHFTLKRPQVQLVTLIKGYIKDVIVDMRRNSKSFGKWIGINLRENGPNQIYIPKGFAHGFYVMSDYAELSYKVSEYYDPDDDYGILWNDKTLNISWPSLNPKLSMKDKRNKSFSFYKENDLLF